MTDERNPGELPVEEVDDDAQEALVEESSPAESLHDAIGAYLLDALPDDERAAFEQFLETSPEAQEELRQLQPVVALLPALFETEALDTEATPAPAPAMREQLIAAAEEERPAAAARPSRTEAPDTDASPARARTIRTTPEATGPFGVDASRQRGGARARGGAQPTPISGFRTMPMSLLAAGLAGLIAIGAVIWALALQGRLETKDREIRAQAAQISELRRNANATAFTLAANDGAAEATGTLLFSVRDQIGVLYVQSLPGLDEGRVYQLWYLNDDSTAPVPGGTFRVDRNGNGVLVVDPETPTYDAIALTEEPQGGSEAPTSEILLQGRLGGAAG